MRSVASSLEGPVETGGGGGDGGLMAVEDSR